MTVKARGPQDQASLGGIKGNKGEVEGKVKEGW